MDLGSGIGSARSMPPLRAMVTAREYQVAAIVAVWKDEEERLFVLPPCGRCRELLRRSTGGTGF